MSFFILTLGLPVALAFKDTAGFDTLRITQALVSTYSTPISVPILSL
jgi:hypothetical protein